MPSDDGLRLEDFVPMFRKPITGLANVPPRTEGYLANSLESDESG
jgi:hypothetical protein